MALFHVKLPPARARRGPSPPGHKAEGWWKDHLPRRLLEKPTARPACSMLATSLPTANTCSIRSSTRKGRELYRLLSEDILDVNHKTFILGLNSLFPAHTSGVSQGENPVISLPQFAIRGQ